MVKNGKFYDGSGLMGLRPEVRGGLTWTICRGCTDSVGKFPRPWIGTLSPRMESKRRTWSQHSTLTRRLWSEASPGDMTTGPDCTQKIGGGANTTSPGQNAQEAERDGPMPGQSWRKLLQDGGLVREIRHVRAEASSRAPVPSSVTLDPARSRSWTTPAFYPTGINRSLLIGWTLTRAGARAHARNCAYFPCAIGSKTVGNLRTPWHQDAQ